MTTNGCKIFLCSKLAFSKRKDTQHRCIIFHLSQWNWNFMYMFIVESYHHVYLTALPMNRYLRVSYPPWLRLNPCQLFGMHLIWIHFQQCFLIAYLNLMILCYSLEFCSLGFYANEINCNCPIAILNEN